jgi:hypothetical protein
MIKKLVIQNKIKIIFEEKRQPKIATLAIK